MDLDIQIQKLGKIPEIFNFYKFLNNNAEIRHPMLLESVEEQTHTMMFSFIGINPDFLIKGQNTKLEIINVDSERGEKLKEFCLHAEPPVYSRTLPFEDAVPMEIPLLDQLKNLFPITRSAIPELFPRKIFAGGLLGYVGYDVIAPYIGYTPSEAAQEQFPDVLMGLYSTVFAYSHASSSLYLINNSLVNSNKEIPISLDFNKIVENYKKSISEPFTSMTKPKSTKKTSKISKTTAKIITDYSAQLDLDNFKSNMTLETWTDIIEKTKESIYAGDIVQAVLSRQLISESNIDPLLVYESLRQVNPSPYMYFLNFKNVHHGDIHLLGSSPEALVTKDHQKLTTVPIAGTRRRGRTVEDEIRMENELLSDEKELAEHIMLVDLARNDLARISTPGSVETTDLIQLRKYPAVMHLISKVQSHSDMDPISILKSMFPAGTVSGAPKKKAMELIQKLEPTNRGPYAGCVGYISFSGDMDMAIAIRTIFNKNKTFIAQAGAGIVADSKPQSEYLETENKMKGTLKALINAEENCA